MSTAQKEEEVKGYTYMLAGIRGVAKGILPHFVAAGDVTHMHPLAVRRVYGCSKQQALAQKTRERKPRPRKPRRLRETPGEL